MNAFRSLGIFLREKPDVVISTGVLAMIPLCLFAKLFGKKRIFIESFAKVSSPDRNRFVFDRFHFNVILQNAYRKKHKETKNGRKGNKSSPAIDE